MNNYYLYLSKGEYKAYKGIRELLIYTPIIEVADMQMCKAAGILIEISEVAYKACPNKV